MSNGHGLWMWIRTHVPVKKLDRIDGPLDQCFSTFWASSPGKLKESFKVTVPVKKNLLSFCPNNVCFSAQKHIIDVVLKFLFKILFTWLNSTISVLFKLKLVNFQKNFKPQSKGLQVPVPGRVPAVEKRCTRWSQKNGATKRGRN